MGLQLNLDYPDLLQLIHQLSEEELQRLKKDVNNAIKANQKIPKLLQYLIDSFQLIEEAITNTQLNGLLYLIDFGHYALYQQSITGFSYQKSALYPYSIGIADIFWTLDERCGK
ncbi:MAG: hypothetical protein ACPGVB_01755 [Chitinophagales bacterium]